MKTGAECHNIINKGMYKVTGVSSFLLGGDVLAFNIQVYAIGNMSTFIIKSTLIIVRENLQS